MLLVTNKSKESMYYHVLCVPDVALISSQIWSDACICVLSHVFCMLHTFSPRSYHGSNIWQWVEGPYFFWQFCLLMALLLVSIWVVSWLGCVNALTGWQEVAAHSCQINTYLYFASHCAHFILPLIVINWNGRQLASLCV